MMNHILLVAMREFRQIATTRSFWLTLLILPAALAIGPLTQRFMSKDEADRVMLIDRSGGDTARAIEARFDLERQRAILTDLSRYVQRHHLDAVAPRALWSRHDRWYSDADVANFVASGGVTSALVTLKRAMPDGTPAFVPKKPDYAFLPATPAVAAADDATIDAQLQPLLHPTGKDAKPLDYAVLIPADFGRSPLVRIWSNGDAAARFVGTLQPVLTRQLRSRYLEANGVSSAAARTANDIAPALAIATPPPAAARANAC